MNTQRRYKKHIYLICCVITLGISSVTFLSFVALKPGEVRNGFLRQLKVLSVVAIDTIVKAENVVDFAGRTYSHLYFKTKNPSVLWVTDRLFQKGHYMQVDLPEISKEIVNYNTIVDSPVIYIMAGNIPAVIEVKNNKASVQRFPDARFTKSVLISPNNFVFRLFKNKNQIFIKGNPANNTIISKNQLFGTGDDKGVSTDGLLHFDSKTNSLIYILYYRNKIITLDTNLNVHYEAKTIDTFSTIHLGIEGIPETEWSPNTTQKLFVNRRSAVSNGYLFNHSRVQAENEDNLSFESNSVIDVYDLHDGSYKRSFYLPSCYGSKMQRFIVDENDIYVLYKNHVVRYSLVGN
jgi:hypothetical protein